MTGGVAPPSPAWGWGAGHRGSGEPGSSLWGGSDMNTGFQCPDPQPRLPCVCWGGKLPLAGLGTYVIPSSRCDQPCAPSWPVVGRLPRSVYGRWVGICAEPGADPAVGLLFASTLGALRHLPSLDGARVCWVLCWRRAGPLHFTHHGGPPRRGSVLLSSCLEVLSNGQPPALGRWRGGERCGVGAQVVSCQEGR